MPSFNKDLAIKHLRANAGRSSMKKCGVRTREAIAAGGIDLDRHKHACDYGSSLRSAGFRSIGSPTTGIQAGDVVVVGCTSAHEDGHMAMYDGTQWISDFYQNSLSIYRDMPSYTIYRFGE